MEVTTRTVSATTTRTTAAHTALTGNVIPIDLLHIPLATAMAWVDFSIMVIAITKPRNAGMRTTETAHALGIAPHPKPPELAQTLADIMTSKSNNVSTIRAVAHIITKTTNAMGIETRFFQKQLVQV